MTNIITQSIIALVISIFIWIFISFILSWQFILYHDIECHFADLSVMLERHQVWTTFAFTSGVMFPWLPMKIQTYLWKNRQVNNEAMRYIAFIIGFSSLTYGQFFLTSQAFEKCT